MTDYTLRLSETLATLERIATEHAPAALASSMAAEDMVLTDMIVTEGLPIGIFTLDTGRLHAETLQMLERIREQYGVSIAVYRPDAEAVAAWVAQHGVNGFYDGVAQRQECCHIRKVEPLQRALQGNSAWITGQRRAQSSTRATLDVREHDAVHGIEKFNPLAEWSEDDVWHYLRSRNVPTNPLHARGYPSIGCEPCTRAIQPGEDIRAGRWWWEEADTKECGLHLVGGKLIRIKQEAKIS